VICLNIGENIKKYRKEKKITQTKLAALIAKSESTIQKYEGGSVVPDIVTLTKIAAVLGKSINDLVGNTPTVAEEIIDKLILMDGQPLEQIATQVGIPIDELTNYINRNKKLSLESFQKICEYRNLPHDERAFSYSNYFYETSNESFRVVVFYKYLEDQFGISLHNVNDDYNCAGHMIAKRLNINISFKETDKKTVTDIIVNLDEYKKIINFIYDYGNLYHSNFNINNLTDEEYYNLYNKIVNSLDFEIFNLIKEEK